MEKPLVSIIIVNWNRKQDIIETLPSVYEQKYENYEIILVDNGSTDGTVEMLQSEHPDVRIVALEDNLGPTGGRNAGIEIAKGDVVFFLDSDGSLLPDTLDITVEKLLSDPTYGVIACNIINVDPNNPDEKAGWSFNSQVERDKEFLSFSFSEGGCAFRKEVFEKAGLFWEYLFFGREGEELGLRVWNAGYKILYYPRAVVHHRASPQTRVIGSQREYLDLRNCYYIYLARYPWWMMIRFLFLKTGVAVIRGITRRNFQQTTARAIGEVLRKLPELLRQREPISNETAVQYIQLLRDHGTLSWNLMSWMKHKARA